MYMCLINHVYDPLLAAISVNKKASLLAHGYSVGNSVRSLKQVNPNTLILILINLQMVAAVTFL